MAGWRVQEVAQARGYNPHSLATKTGVSYVTIRKIWQNETTRTDLSTIEVLCRVLAVTPTALMDVGDGTPTPPAES